MFALDAVELKDPLAVELLSNSNAVEFADLNVAFDSRVCVAFAPAMYSNGDSATGAADSATGALDGAIVSICSVSIVSMSTGSAATFGESVAS